MGRMFGRWEVVGEPVKINGVWREDVQCSCAHKTRRFVRRPTLNNGTSTSCGCARSETCAAAEQDPKERQKTYLTRKIYEGMRRRCEKDKTYIRRGIKVCDRWLGPEGFKNFLADVGKRPGANFSLNRIDNDKGYEPNNVEWTDRFTQANNTSRNRFVECDGCRKTISEWARELGVATQTLASRINRHGDEAIRRTREHVQRGGGGNWNTKWIEYNGETLTTQMWAEKFGVSPKLLNYRIREYGEEEAMRRSYEAYRAGVKYIAPNPRPSEVNNPQR